MYRAISSSQWEAEYPTENLLHVRCEWQRKLEIELLSVSSLSILALVEQFKSLAHHLLVTLGFSKLLLPLQNVHTHWQKTHSLFKQTTNKSISMQVIKLKDKEFSHPAAWNERLFAVVSLIHNYCHTYLLRWDFYHKFSSFSSVFHHIAAVNMWKTSYSHYYLLFLKFWLQAPGWWNGWGV